MRHHAAAEADGRLAPWVAEVRDALGALARGDAAAPRARLDAVLAALDAADGLMGGLARRQRQDAALEAAGLGAALAAARAAAAAAEADLAQAADAGRRRAAETAAAQAALLRAQAALAGLGAGNARLRAELGQREAELGQRAAELETLRGSRSWRLTRPLRTVAGRLRGGKPPPRPKPKPGT
jgi:hypothetical protein